MLGMYKKILMIYVLFTSSIIFFLDARAVSYPQAWTIMTKNNAQTSRFHVHYSPSYTHSLGMVFEEDRLSRTSLYHLQTNYLILRKNTRKTQRNLYLKAQLGVAHQGKKSAESYRLTLDGDWESRRYFSSYHINVHSRGFLKHPYIDQQLRLGFAPYIAPYGALHTWIFGQLNHYPSVKIKSKHVIYQLILRFFKGANLVEIGIDQHKQGMLNFIRRL